MCLSVTCICHWGLQTGVSVSGVLLSGGPLSVKCTGVCLSVLSCSLSAVSRASRLVCLSVMCSCQWGL